MFHARYAERKHSATRIHPGLQDLSVGDLVPYGAGAYSPMHELEPNGTWPPVRPSSCGDCPGNRTSFLAIVPCR